jgi:translation elongation factor EF-G
MAKNNKTKAKVTPATRTYTRNMLVTTMVETIKYKGTGTGNFTSASRNQKTGITIDVCPADEPSPTNIVKRYVVDEAKKLFINICVSNNFVKEEHHIGIINGIKKTKGELTGGDLSSLTLNVTNINIDTYGSLVADSDTVLAFEQATILAIKQAFKQSSPVLLMPKYKVTVCFEEADYTNVMLLITHHRGIPTNMDSFDKYPLCTFEMKYANLIEFEAAYKNIGSAGGQYDAEFIGYDDVSGSELNAILEKYKKN